MNNLKDSLVLVTGSAQGIGKLIALSFAKEGAKVILTDVQKDKLSQTEKEFKNLGYEVYSYFMDVTDSDSIEDVKNKINSKLGKIQVLVNNAGVVFGGPFLETDLSKHNLTYDINVKGMTSVTHKFLSDLISSKDSHLINIASASGFLGLPYGASYAASKWAAIGFSESIRLELKYLKYKNVRVTTVCPSYINTGMFAGVKAPTFTPILEPDEIVAKIIFAVKKNKLFVMEPWIVKTIPLLKGILPIKIVDFIVSILNVNTSMIQWHGHGTATENLKKIQKKNIKIPAKKRKK